MEIAVKLRCLFKNDFTKRKKQIFFGNKTYSSLLKEKEKKTKNL